jgi:hypothetical protein
VAGDIDAREERLPKWARQELTRLRNANASVERRVAEADQRAEQARLSTNPDESLVLLEDWKAGDIGLGDEARVRFYMDDSREERRGGDYVMVRRLGKGELEIHGSRSLIVRLNASNTFRLSAAPW